MTGPAHPLRARQRGHDIAYYQRATHFTRHMRVRPHASGLLVYASVRGGGEVVTIRAPQSHQLTQQAKEELR